MPHRVGRAVAVVDVMETLLGAVGHHSARRNLVVGLLDKREDG